MNDERTTMNDKSGLRTANCGLRSLLMFRQKNFGIVADFF